MDPDYPELYGTTYYVRSVGRYLDESDRLPTLPPAQTLVDAGAEQIAQALAADGYFTKAATGDRKACSLFARLVAYRANPSGSSSSWGWLTKQPGETQHEGYAEDSIVYGADPNDLQNVVDLIVGAGAPGATLGWQQKPRRPGNTWERPQALSPADMEYLKAGSGTGTGGGGGGTGGTGTGTPCKFTDTAGAAVRDLLPVVQSLNQSVEDLAVVIGHMREELASLRIDNQALRTVLTESGLQIDASARIIGRVSGTARLPRG